MRPLLTVAAAALVGLVVGQAARDWRDLLFASAAAKPVKEENPPPPAPPSCPTDAKSFPLRVELITVGEHQYVAFVTLGGQYGGLRHYDGCDCWEPAPRQLTSLSTCPLYEPRRAVPPNAGDNFCSPSPAPAPR